jgi:short-subunit dehydrogenase
MLLWFAVAGSIPARGWRFGYNIDTMMRKRVLLTGATGYIGGRLAPRLIEQGYAVRVLARVLAKRAEQMER